MRACLKCLVNELIEFQKMVYQKPAKKVTKTKVRKGVKTSERRSEDEKQLELKGPREAAALEVLHAMFMKRLAEKSNFVAFQNKKNFVDKLIFKAGAKVAMDECLKNDEHENDSD